MMSKSTISTAAAEMLLRDGWVLKTHKSRLMGHSYYVHNEARRGFCGSARYINKDVFDTLVARGYFVKPNTGYSVGDHNHSPNEKNPNFRDENGKLFLVRCYVCDPVDGTENLAGAVASGECAHCGWTESSQEIL